MNVFDPSLHAKGVQPASQGGLKGEQPLHVPGHGHQALLAAHLIPTSATASGREQAEIDAIDHGAVAGAIGVQFVARAADGLTGTNSRRFTGTDHCRVRRRPWREC
jgi:hypothetical protein